MEKLAGAIWVYFETCHSLAEFLCLPGEAPGGFLKTQMKFLVHIDLCFLSALVRPCRRLCPGHTSPEERILLVLGLGARCAVSPCACDVCCHVCASGFASAGPC